MKFVAFFVILLIFVDLSVQIPQLVNCPPDFVLSESMKTECGVLTCTGRNSISGVGCGQWQCQEGKEVGYIPSDSSKLYPDCCGGPICAD